MAQNARIRSVLAVLAASSVVLAGLALMPIRSRGSGRSGAGRSAGRADRERIGSPRR
jgi:hypothetical protein